MRDVPQNIYLQDELLIFDNILDVSSRYVKLIASTEGGRPSMNIHHFNSGIHFCFDFGGSIKPNCNESRWALSTLAV